MGAPTADSGWQRKMAPLRQARQPRPADQGLEPAASHPRAPSRRGCVGRGGRTHLATPHLKAPPRPWPKVSHGAARAQSTAPTRPRAPGSTTSPWWTCPLFRSDLVLPQLPASAPSPGPRLLVRLSAEAGPRRGQIRSSATRPGPPSPRPQALPIRPQLPWRRLGAKAAG